MGALQTLLAEHTQGQRIHLQASRSLLADEIGVPARDTDRDARQGAVSVARAGEINVKDLAEREGVTASRISRIARLAFLSPTIVEAVWTASSKAT